MVLANTDKELRAPPVRRALMAARMEVNSLIASHRFGHDPCAQCIDGMEVNR